MVAPLTAPDSWQVLLNNCFICGQVLWLIQKPPVILMRQLHFKFLGFLKFQLNSARQHPNTLDHWWLVLVGSRTQFSTSEPSSLAGSWNNDTRKEAAKQVDSPIWLPEERHKSRAADGKFSRSAQHSGRSVNYGARASLLCVALPAIPAAKEAPVLSRLFFQLPFQFCESSSMVPNCSVHLVLYFKVGDPRQVTCIL